MTILRISDRRYIKEDLPVLWTMLFRKTTDAGRARSINPILPEELNKLVRIFEDKFEKRTDHEFVPYQRPACAKNLEIPLETSEDGSLKLF